MLMIAVWLALQLAGEMHGLNLYQGDHDHDVIIDLLYIVEVLSNGKYLCIIC